MIRCYSQESNFKAKVKGEGVVFFVVELAVLVYFLKDHMNKSEQYEVELHL